MIGADTNVLVRYFVEDDPAQSRRVDALLARGGFHIDDVVLCELVWVLRSGYRFDRPAIAKALGRILATAEFSFNDRDLLRRALADYQIGSADFSDYVIGRRNELAGCEATVTFDRALRDNPSFRVL